MSDALDTVLEAVFAMDPITKSWLVHGPVVTVALSMLSIEDLDDDQLERLADGCHDWGGLLTGGGLGWWDAEEHIREELRRRREEAA